MTVKVNTASEKFLKVKECSISTKKKKYIKGRKKISKRKQNEPDFPGA